MWAMNAAPLTGRAALVSALRQALAGVGIAAEPELMPDLGLAHDHLRLAGMGLVARLPKQSQMNLAPEDNLAYQAACYSRTAPSGHTPALHAVLKPSPSLPRGGLLVEEIRGRPARLPDDLDAIMTALAAIHSLAVPPPDARAPLLSPDDPLDSLLGEITAQAAYIEAAKPAPATRALIEDNMAVLRAEVAASARPDRHLISFDAHPGNFLVDSEGRAVLVDLEKCRYSAPQLDLAHATLYTSTTWDVASHAVLSTRETAAACALWLERLDLDEPARERARAWIVPMRRAMWLWSITWCAKWRVLSERTPTADTKGEGWAADKSEAALIAHVRGRVDHYLEPLIARAVTDEFADLSRRFESAAEMTRQSG